MARNPLKKKMNQTVIESILAILVQRGFESRIAAVEKSMRELGDKFFDTMLSSADRERLNALPAGWVPSTEHMAVRLRDHKGEVAKRTVSVFGPAHRSDTIECRTSPSRSELAIRLTGNKRIPSSMKYATFLDIDSNHALVDQHIDLMDQLADIKEERYTFKKDTRQLLYTLGTWEKLYINWPDINPLVKHLEPVAPVAESMPPATAFKEMNTLLGLPDQVTA